jgi:DNA ligase 4
MFYKDQYHMGYTMRFPRALSIRDDLSIADCMTASGIFLFSFFFPGKIYKFIIAVMDSLRTERKRKMESDAG